MRGNIVDRGFFMQANAYIRESIKNNRDMMKELELVRALNLPEWCIAAGYVRNYVWDHLHNCTVRTPLNDIDVIYYDPADLSESREKEWERILQRELPLNWSVKNQARMHIRNHEQPYTSIEDAMKRWPETATATGIRLTEDNELVWIAPHGDDDLFNLVVRRSPFFKDRHAFAERTANKKWLEQWPKLRVVEDKHDFS
jgi:hypothetical protein